MISKVAKFALRVRDIGCLKLVVYSKRVDKRDTSLFVPYCLSLLFLEVYCQLKISLTRNAKFATLLMIGMMFKPDGGVKFQLLISLLMFVGYVISGCDLH